MVNNLVLCSPSMHSCCTSTTLLGFDPFQRRIGQIDAISRFGNRSYREYSPLKCRGNSGFPMKAREIGWIRKEEM